MPGSALRELVTLRVKLFLRAPLGAVHSSSSVSWHLLPSLPLLSRKRRHDLLPGTWLSPAPVSPRCRACAVPRKGRVLLLTPHPSGGMMMLSRTWWRPWLHVPLSCVDARQACPINHGSKRVMSPHSTDARVVLLGRLASAAGLGRCSKA